MSRGSLSSLEDKKMSKRRAARIVDDDEESRRREGETEVVTNASGVRVQRSTRERKKDPTVDAS